MPQLLSLWQQSTPYLNGTPGATQRWELVRVWASLHSADAHCSLYWTTCAQQSMSCFKIGASRSCMPCD